MIDEYATKKVFILKECKIFSFLRVQIVAANMGSNFDSILTWPRNQAPPKLSSDEKKDLVLFNFTLVNLKQFAKNNNDPKIHELIEAMEEFISSNNAINEYGNALAFEGLRKEPQFDSMILCETPPQTTRTRINSISHEHKLSTVLDLPPAIPTEIDEPYEPVS